MAAHLFGDVDVIQISKEREPEESGSVSEMPYLVNVLLNAYSRHFDVLAHVMVRGPFQACDNLVGIFIDGASGMSESAISSFIKINPVQGSSQEMAHYTARRTI